MWRCSPESCLKKLSSCQVRVLEEIFGSELLVFFCLGVRLVFVAVVFAYVSALLGCLVLPKAA